jgi:hypothetical protein
MRKRFHHAWLKHASTPVKLLKTTVVARNAAHDQRLIPVATEGQRWREWGGRNKGQGKNRRKEEGWVRGKAEQAFAFLPPPLPYVGCSNYYACVSATISAHQQETRVLDLPRPAAYLSVPLFSPPAAPGFPRREERRRGLPVHATATGGRSPELRCQLRRDQPWMYGSSLRSSVGLVRSRLRFACRLICWVGSHFFWFLEGMLFHLLRCDLVARGWGSASHPADDLACLFMCWCAWPWMILSK